MAQVDREALKDFYFVYIVSEILKKYSMTGSAEEDTNQDVRKYSIAKRSTEELNKILTDLIEWILSESCTNRIDMLRSTEVFQRGNFFILKTIH